MNPTTIKRVLLAPAPIRKIAASRVGPREAWMLRQPREVRESYCREVLEAGGGGDEAAEAWMLLQPQRVRKSYVREVLNR